VAVEPVEAEDEGGWAGVNKGVVVVHLVPFVLEGILMRIFFLGNAELSFVMWRGQHAEDVLASLLKRDGEEETLIANKRMFSHSLRNYYKKFTQLFSK
jgi:hypothetical protein